MPGDGEIFEVEQEVPFKWPKETRLQALTAVTVILPGALVREGEAIGSIIDAPEDAAIGFVPSPDGKGFESIHVKLKSGESIGVHRSSMAIVQAANLGPVQFRVERV